ncbi:MAG: hypothetical protein N3E51_02405 [Candidatus Micrarchaeota archaeon]|nr:hypothetical protein [Candidatus Micrarchaeota archaeon]
MGGKTLSIRFSTDATQGSADGSCASIMFFSRHMKITPESLAGLAKKIRTSLPQIYREDVQAKPLKNGVCSPADSIKIKFLVPREEGLLDIDIRRLDEQTVVFKINDCGLGNRRIIETEILKAIKSQFPLTEPILRKPAFCGIVADK